MASTFYTDFTTPAVNAAWLNDVNDLTYGINDGSLVGQGDALIAVHRPATGSVTISQHTFNNLQEVTMEEFGGAPGAGDNTAVLAAIIAAYPNGVRIRFATVGEWKMNGVVVGTSISLEMTAGKGEYDVNCIRPFDITKPALTIGDGTTLTRYCGLYNCHISGTNATVPAQTNAAGNAPQALLVKGGVADLHVDRTVVYNGIQTVALIPTLNGASITGVSFTRCHFRNDLTNVANARTVYAARYEHNITSPDLGYLTALTFTNTRMNGPKVAGKVAHFDQLGNVGITAVFTDCYADCAPGCGVRLTGGSGLVVKNFQIDPGTSNAVVLETDASSLALARYVTGNLRCGSQRFQNGLGVSIAIPGEADSFSYRHLLQQPYITGPVLFGSSLDPYGAAGVPSLDLSSTTGPVYFENTDVGIKTRGNGLRIAEGANAMQGVAPLVAGSAVVAHNNFFKATARIQVTRNPGSGANGGAAYVDSAIDNVSFTIKSTNAADTGQVCWTIFKEQV